MHKLKLSLLLLGLTAVLNVLAAPGDGTFTFRITGPGGENQMQETALAASQERESPRAAARQTTAPTANPPREEGRTAVYAANPARNAEPVSPGTRYTVQRSDTIWSIAHRVLPTDGSVNEFQAVAAIYRHNPDAFGNGNVNNLRTVTLTIPPSDDMAREDTATGSRLLREGSLTLPPLTAASEEASPQSGSSAQPEAQGTAQAASSVLTDGTEPAAMPREYVARETMAREGERNLLAATAGERQQENALLPVAEADVSTADGERRNAEDSALSEKAPAAPAEPISAENMDFQVIRELIDSANKAIEKTGADVEKKLDTAIKRTQTVAENAAASVAREEVSEVMARYESLISDLQQSNAELRANISKLGRQIDQVRSISIENSDNLAAMEERLLAADTDTSNAFIPHGPMMWMLLGVGIMALTLAGSLFFFKRRLRQDAAGSSSEDEFEDDLSSTELISSTVALSEEDREKLKEQEENPASEESKEGGEETQKAPETQGSEAEHAEAAAEAEDESGKRRILDTDEVQIPESMFKENENLARKAREAQQAKEEAEARKAAEAARKAEDEKLMQDWQEQNKIAPEVSERIRRNEEEIKKAWEDAAREKEDDKATLDAWSEALKEQENAAALKATEVKPPENSAVLKDGSDAENPDEALARQWEEALKAQESGKDQSGSGTSVAGAGKEDKALSADEELARQWEEALKAQAEPHPKNDAPDDVDIGSDGASREGEGADPSLKSSPDTTLPQAAADLAAAMANGAEEKKVRPDLPVQKPAAVFEESAVQDTAAPAEESSHAEADTESTPSPAEAPEEQASESDTATEAGVADGPSILQDDAAFADAISALVQSNYEYYPRVHHESFEESDETAVLPQDGETEEEALKEKAESYVYAGEPSLEEDYRTQVMPAAENGAADTPEQTEVQGNAMVKEDASSPEGQFRAPLEDPSPKLTEKADPVTLAQQRAMAMLTGSDEENDAASSEDLPFTWMVPPEENSAASAAPTETSGSVAVQDPLTERVADAASQEEEAQAAAPLSEEFPAEEDEEHFKRLAEDLKSGAGDNLSGLEDSELLNMLSQGDAGSSVPSSEQGIAALSSAQPEEPDDSALLKMLDESAQGSAAAVAGDSAEPEGTAPGDALSPELKEALASSHSTDSGLDDASLMGMLDRTGDTSLNPQDVTTAPLSESELEEMLSPEKAPAGQGMESPAETAAASSLTRSQREKLTAALNLALLYFESGDEEEALSTLSEVEERGDRELKQRVRELKERYAAHA
ncbi:MAG TPA: hypothetical protein IAB18_01575 [Candidatus Avisuccinivibrio pullicola]|nr:hypothetical protein [Candidatus Avisuccinivibrio pullicola]